MTKISISNKNQKDLSIDLKKEIIKILEKNNFGSRISIIRIWRDMKFKYYYVEYRLKYKNINSIGGEVLHIENNINWFVYELITKWRDFKKTFNK